MTSSFLVYPRLSRTRAQALFREVRDAYEAGGLSAVTPLVAAGHPDAAPVPTGGRVATADEIQQCRLDVLGAIDQWFSFGSLPKDRQVPFDVALGEALHRSLRILPADAAHDETWNFLSLVVFPDIVAFRFSDLSEARFLGRYPRNALRRVWQRHEVLGDLLTQAERPIGEDEATGIFERTELSRNHRLVRKLAAEVMSRSDVQGGRSNWAREFFKRVRYTTGPLVLDVLTDDALKALVHSAALEALDARGAAAAETEQSDAGQGRVPFSA